MWDCGTEGHLGLSSSMWSEGNRVVFSSLLLLSCSIYLAPQLPQNPPKNCCSVVCPSHQLPLHHSNEGTADSHSKDSKFHTSEVTTCLCWVSEVAASMVGQCCWSSHTAGTRTRSYWCRSLTSAVGNADYDAFPSPAVHQRIYNKHYIILLLGCTTYGTRDLPQYF